MFVSAVRTFDDVIAVDTVVQFRDEGLAAFVTIQIGAGWTIESKWLSVCHRFFLRELGEPIALFTASATIVGKSLMALVSLENIAPVRANS